MNAFRALLVIMVVCIAVYTTIVGVNHGLVFLPVFFGDMATMGWAGQFNLDFMCMLALSAFWVAWRHCFSALGLVLALVAFFGGAPFLCVYLLIESVRGGGDARAMLLGQRLHDR